MNSSFLVQSSPAIPPVIPAYSAIWPDMFWPANGLAEQRFLPFRQVSNTEPSSVSSDSAAETLLGLRLVRHIAQFLEERITFRNLFSQCNTLCILPSAFILAADLRTFDLPAERLRDLLDKFNDPRILVRRGCAFDVILQFFFQCVRRNGSLD